MPACLPEQLLHSGVSVAALARHRRRHVRRQRDVRPAREVGLRSGPPREHRGGQREVARLARVRGAGERERIGAEAEAVGRAVGDERQGLERLGGRAPEGHQVRIAGGASRLPRASTTTADTGCTDSDPVPASDFRPEVEAWRQDKCGPGGLRAVSPWPLGLAPDAPARPAPRRRRRRRAPECARRARRRRPTCRSTTRACRWSSTSSRAAPSPIPRR